MRLNSFKLGLMAFFAALVFLPFVQANTYSGSGEFKLYIGDSVINYGEKVVLQDISGIATGAGTPVIFNTYTSDGYTLLDSVTLYKGGVYPRVNYAITLKEVFAGVGGQAYAVVEVSAGAPSECLLLENEFAYKEKMHIGDSVTGNGVKIVLADISGIATGAQYTPPVTFKLYELPAGAPMPVIVTLKPGEKYTHAGTGTMIYLCSATTGIGQTAYAQVRFASTTPSGGEAVPVTPVTPTLKMVIKLYSGWNMFSYPYIGTSDVADTSDCTEVKRIYHYDAASRNYLKYVFPPKYIPQDLYATQGLWLKTPSDCEIKVYTAEGEGVSMEGVVLAAGWNQIGGPAEETSFDAIKGNCVVKSGPWLWRNDLKKYEKASVLKPGEGYFVKVSNQCTLGAGEEMPGLPTG